MLLLPLTVRRRSLQSKALQYTIEKGGSWASFFRLAPLDSLFKSSSDLAAFKWQ